MLTGERSKSDGVNCMWHAITLAWVTLFLPSVEAVFVNEMQWGKGKQKKENAEGEGEGEEETRTQADEASPHPEPGVREPRSFVLFLLLNFTRHSGSRYERFSGSGYCCFQETKLSLKRTLHLRGRRRVLKRP